MAAATDAQIKEKFMQNKAGFDLLSLSRGDLSQRIPKSMSVDAVAQNPAVVALRDLLSQLDMIKIQKQEVLAEGSKMLESTNTTDDLMATVSKTKSKEEVFAKYKSLFETHYAKNATFEEQKQ